MFLEEIFKNVEVRLDDLLSELSDSITEFAQDDGLLFKSSTELTPVIFNPWISNDSRNTETDNEQIFKLTKEHVFDFHDKVTGKHYRITIPKGFVFNGASVPMRLRSIMPKDWLFTASLPHDFLYTPEGTIDLVEQVEISSTKPMKTEMSKEVHFDKNDSDIVFRAVLETYIKHKRVAMKAYQAVSYFGASCYAKKPWEK